DAYACGFDYSRPRREIFLDERVEFFGRASYDTRANSADALSQLRIRKRSHNLTMQPINRISRGLGGNDDALPVEEFITRNTRLRNGGHFFQCRVPGERAYSETNQPARFQMLYDGRHRGKDDGGLPADCRRDRGPAIVE